MIRGLHRWNETFEILHVAPFEGFESIGAGQPAAIQRDTDLDHFIPGRVEGRQHGTRGHERDIMFAGPTSKQHCHPKFLHSFVHSPTSSTSNSSSTPVFSFTCARVKLMSLRTSLARVSP